MRYPLAKGLTPAKLGIHVMRKEVTGMPGMYNKICFGNCSS